MYAVYRKYTSLLPRSEAVGFDVGIDREGGCVQCIVHVIHSGVRLLPNSQSFDWGTTQPDIAIATGRDRGTEGVWCTITVQFTIGNVSCPSHPPRQAM